jgi:hypothetical protein
MDLRHADGVMCKCAVEQQRAISNPLAFHVRVACYLEHGCKDPRGCGSVEVGRLLFPVEFINNLKM